MKISVFLVIILFVIFWYGVVPVVGALSNRYKLYLFRQRFDELRLRPILDYRIYRQLEKEETFRFTGGFESITDRKTLWIQGENLTIPVSLADAHAYLLPTQRGEGIPDTPDANEESPERINWGRVTTLAEGAKVYVGGALVFQDEQWIFVSTKEEPLIVIFYDGPDRSLTTRAISAGRRRSEYWNKITPYSLALGALCLILLALSYLHRPAFRLTVITSIIALFIPLFPMIPPGILFTTIHRRLSWQARKFMAYSDLARLPLRYLRLPDAADSTLITEAAAVVAGANAPPADTAGWQDSRLPGGETYTMVCCNSPPKTMLEGKIPPLIPELTKSRSKTWYIFGARHNGEELPVEPDDPFATFGVLPEKPDVLSRRYATTSYLLDIIGLIILLLGIGINLFFVRLILLLL
jgi:hypothetical protein